MLGSGCCIVQLQCSSLLYLFSPHDLPESNYSDSNLAAVNQCCDLRAPAVHMVLMYSARTRCALKEYLFFIVLVLSIGVELRLSAGIVLYWP
jgi:hypothetical protein